jgi:hypothetical protein
LPETAAKRSVRRPIVSEAPIHKSALGPKREVKGLEQVLLCGRLEVDEHVAAAHQVEVGERWIGEQVMGRERDRVAQRALRLEALAGAPKEPLQATRGNVLCDGGGVSPPPCDRQGCIAGVGGEHLQLEAASRGLELLEKTMARL